MSATIQGNLLLQGVANASPWLTTEELLAPARQNSLLARNEMLNRVDEQTMRSADTEMIARASAYLMSLPDETARRAAYPGLRQTLQAQKFAMNAPEEYPGEARIAALAAMGTPSKELLEAANVQRALAGSGTPQNQTQPTGAAPAAPASGFTGDREQDRALIVKQESGGDPTALNYVARNDPTAYARGATASGKYQFVNSTWREGMQLAGLDPNQYPTAREAPEAVQDKVFDAVYAKYGTRPWQKGPQDWVPNEQGQYQLVTVRPPAGTPGGAPVTAVTAQQPPVRGVAARTGGTDVAGPGAGTGGTTATGGATAAATSQQPPAATTAAAGISPPTPPQPTNGNGLTPAQQQTINTEKALVRTREQANAVLTKEQQYRDANVTAQRQYQADQIAYQSAVGAQQAEARAQRGEGRQDQAAADTHAESLQRQRAAEAAALQPFTKDQLQQANTLRDEFTKQTETFRTVQTAYENIRSAAKASNGAGDMSMLYSYVKLLDPTSAVREGEFATAAASGSFGQRIQGLVERVMSGARLEASLRQQFLSEARNIYENNKKTHDQVADQYEGLAKRAGLPSDLVVLRSAREQPDVGSLGPKPGDVEDGYRFKGGDPGKKESWEKVK